MKKRRGSRLDTLSQDRRPIASPMARISAILIRRRNDLSGLNEFTRRLRSKQAVVFTALFLITFDHSALCQGSLTLSSAIDLALKNNQQVVIAANERSATEKVRAEFANGSLPQFKVGLSTIYAPTTSSFGYDPALSNGGQLSGQVFLQQSIFEGGARSARSDQLTIDVRKAAIGMLTVKRDLRYAVTAAFIDALRFRDEVVLLESSIAQLRDYLDAARRRFLGGGASQSDVLRAEVELSNSQVALGQAMTSYTVARYGLAELLGGTIDSSIVPSGNLEGLLETPPEQTPGRLLDLELAHAEEDRSALDVRLAETESNPVIAMFADAGMLSSIQNLRLAPNDRSAILGYSVGVTVEFPLFDWGSRSLRREARALQRASLTAGTTLLERKIRSDMARLTLQLNDARRRLGMLRQNVLKSKEVFLLTTSRYSSGNALAVEVLGAHQLVFDTELATLQTLAEIQTTSARIVQLTTKDDE